MKKPLTQNTNSFREQGSKFIGFLFPITSIEQFDLKLEEIISGYPDATHHCYAWRLDPIQPKEFAQDDGEPGGTAGLPILNRIKSFDVVEAAIVVVRYFGGTKLGKSGLIEAYGRSAQNCLETATLKDIRPVQKVEISYPYSEQNYIEQLIHRFDLEEIESSYLKKVTLTMACPLPKIDGLNKQLEAAEHRNISSRLLETTYL